MGNYNLGAVNLKSASLRILSFGVSATQKLQQTLKGLPYNSGVHAA
jgi:hypothetical protein